MSNRQKLLDAAKDAPQELADEIDYKVNDIDHEDAYDAADAILDIYDDAEHNGERKLLNACRVVLIAAGYYRPMSQDEIDNTHTWSSSGRKANPWCFKRNKIAYTCDEGINPWLYGA